MQLKSFTFCPFSENTYVLYDDSKECVIVDPGCYDDQERNELKKFISENELKPVMLLNTHCHLDHVFGNAFVMKEYGVELIIHQEDLVTLSWAKEAATKYGLEMEESPEPNSYFDMKKGFSFGSTHLEIRFCPGHAPGHVAFIHHETKVVIGGDVLFQGSIGRTDLPGGNFEVLKKSIEEQFYTLPEDYLVYSGHGPETSIGLEKKQNAFVRG
jgi:glyoxylase-like metal-dependent hydrolase (beta-lactamase superfamily II)